MTYIILFGVVMTVIVTATILPRRNYSRLIDYIMLRRVGVRNAWEIAGMPVVGDRLVGVTVTVIFSLMVAYLISDKANAMILAADERVSNATFAQQAYVAGLERIVAACVTDTHGKLIKIGEDYFLCGISPLGSFR